LAQLLAQGKAAPLAKKEVQVVEVAESGAITHEALGGFAMVQGESVSQLMEGDLGQTLIIDALRSRPPFFQVLEAEIGNDGET
jgi:hypothetical protein